MKNIKLIYPVIIAVLIALFGSSCQKVIDLKLKNADAQLVIEGNLTSRFGHQTVRISRSVPFGERDIFPQVSGAKVSISDQAGNTFQFKEDSAGTYSYPALRGSAGKTYTLSVQLDGKTYTAHSTMPEQVKLDSIGSNIDSFDDKNRSITVYYFDPLNVVNRYRFILYVNAIQVKTVFANDDNFTDGHYVHEELFQDNMNIRPGDNVTVEMQCLDEDMFKYWFSLRQQQSNNPGGGTAPSNPPTNISGGALGYFSVHTTVFYSIIVKR